MTYSRILTILTLLCLPLTHVRAQDDTQRAAYRKTVRQHLRQGNRQMRGGHRDDAIASYQKAYGLDSIDGKTLYNLATALMPAEYWRPWPQRNDTLKAKEVNHIDSLFLAAAEHEENPLQRAKSFYNMGVMHQSLYQSGGKEEQHLERAIEAYKNALRNDPTDEAARYNLVVCQRQLKKKSNDDQQNNQQQQDQQDQQQEQQNQDQQKQEQQNQNQQPPKEQQQQQMDEQRMNQMLENAMQKERDVQRRMNEAQQNTQRNRRSNQKNW